MDFTLNAAEVRVLASLIEKEITTPEYYPQSLNALVNACNQKSNRDPVVAYDEDTVGDSLDSLRAKGLSTTISGAGSRVLKYAHRFSEKLNLGRREIAVLCELMLRGPQTPGELRNRTERLHRFDDLSSVESVLDHLPGYVVKLPRRPGEKENRYAHLFSGAIEAAAPADSAPLQDNSLPRQDRLAALEAEVADLRGKLEDLLSQFAQFRKQFE